LGIADGSSAGIILMSVEPQQAAEAYIYVNIGIGQQSWVVGFIQAEINNDPAVEYIYVNVTA
jgi:hypothetical protein